ncbi:MAG TPA: hypothetical protein VHH36_03390 [Candidatus Thermoplasmatota archaeon]|nr:hypothetical protein [Candidatus Thermoplasmatota archaeon]
MAAWSLAASALLAVATAAAFAHVARVLRRRSEKHAGRRALRWFAGFWALCAAFALVGAAQLLGAVLDAPLAAFVLARHAQILLGCGAVALLLAYLLHLFTGREGTLLPAAALYGVLGAVSVAETARLRPSGVRVTDWRVELAYAQAPDAFTLLVLLLVFAPPIVGAVAYASLWRKAPTRGLRVRIALVSSALLLWHAGQLVSRMADSDLWIFATRPLLGLAAAGCVLLAYARPD